MTVSSIDTVIREREDHDLVDVDFKDKTLHRGMDHG